MLSVCRSELMKFCHSNFKHLFARYLFGLQEIHLPINQIGRRFYESIQFNYFIIPRYILYIKGLVDMDGVVLNDVLEGRLSGEESQFLLAQAGLTLLLLWR